MEENLLNAILKDTFTLDSFKKRYMVLKIALEKRIYGSSSTIADKDAKQVSQGLLNEKSWADNFDQSVTEGINSENFHAVNEYIDNFISNATTLSIYFVFIPDHAQVKEIGEWLRTSLNNPKLIFDVKIDPSLIGGCAIAYKGVYKDYSLKARIEANKEKLMEEFRRYLKQ
jgi:F0F1-type ATP synthase delta subunit